MRLGGRRDAPRDGDRIADLANLHDEALEIVVVVIELIVVMGLAVLDVVLGADAESEQRGGIDLALRHHDDLDRAGQRAGDCGDRLRHALGIEQVALVEHDEIGAGDLILEHLFDRIVVIERRVGPALLSERIEIGARPDLRPAPRRRPRRQRHRR